LSGGFGIQVQITAARGRRLNPAPSAPLLPLIGRVARLASGLGP